VNEFYKTHILANPCEINLDSKEITKLKEHCEKQIRLSNKFNDPKHYEEHELVLRILNNYEVLQKQIADLKQKNKFLINNLKTLKEFYINDFEENNIGLIPLSNLSKNIDIILKGLEGNNE
jgi:hypothetical protein